MHPLISFISRTSRNNLTISNWVTAYTAISLPSHHRLTILTCRSGHTWPGGRDSQEQVSSLTVLLRSVSHREKGECNEMAAAHINTEEGWSITHYHSDSSIPTKASAKVIHTRPKSETKASKWLIALFRKNLEEISQIGMLSLESSLLVVFVLIGCLFQCCFSNVLEQVRMWGWICDHESCCRSLVLALWTGADATTKKPHETRSSDARRTPERSLGNCVTESAAVFLTTSILFFHCDETCGLLYVTESASYSEFLWVISYL